jgi:hypothetical protein
MRLRGALGLLVVILVLGLSPLRAQARFYESPPRLEALTAEQQELLRKAQSLIEPTTEEKIMYHYGGAAPCQKLNEAGSYTGAIYEKYSRIRTNSRAIAGHGVYVAGNPSSSSNYFKGGITQVVLAPGTPMIDLTRLDTRARLAALGLETDDIYNLPVDAVVRYGEVYDWYAIKGATGVRFQALDVAKTSSGDLGQLIRELGPPLHTGPESARVVKVAVAELRVRKGDLSGAWVELGQGLPRTWSVLREFPVAARIQALDSLLLNRPLDVGFRASRLESRFGRRDTVKEVSQVMLADLRTRLEGGRELSDLELKRLVFISGVEGVDDWSLADTVKRLAPAQQQKLVGLLEGLLDGYKPGKRTGFFPEPRGLESMSRLISALGAVGGVRTPANEGAPVAGVQTLAERYLILMREQYQRPLMQLPSVPTSRVQSSCNGFLRSTLHALVEHAAPLGIPAGVLYVGYIGARQLSRQDREARLTHAQGLCAAGGGKFGRDDSSGGGFCDCGAGVRVSFPTWTDLPKANVHQPLCARSQ